MAVTSFCDRSQVFTTRGESVMMVTLRLLTAGLLLIGAGSASPSDLGLIPGVSGCGKKPDVALNTRINATLPSGRTYLFWVPPNYNYRKETALIFAFHGATKTPENQADLDLLTTPFFNKDHIVVYPSSGEYGANAGRYWQGAPQVPADVDDVAYVLQILDAVEARFCVDRARVYATGKSQGGMMTNNLACDARSAARVAAFAPVSGSYYVNVTGAACTPATLQFTNCRPARPLVPVFIFHGGNDHTINYAGGPRSGECLPDIPHFVEAWARRDWLSDSPQRVEPVPGAGDNATWYKYGFGGPTDLVEFIYAGDHVDHQWPATIPNSDSVEHDSPPATFNASSIIMDFFGRYTL
ncbi:Alpha/Beta hydrolase protein [Xylaria cf. heliscus]|nr:Alpha/Beta hydrolase protein [Xylaria cf. heliscus]